MKRKREGRAPRVAKSAPERRSFLRLPLAVPVFARGVDARGKEFLEFTTTLNISAGGALLAMRRPVPLDSTVYLEIPTAPLPKVSATPTLIRTLEARVVRISFSEPSYLWALRFNRPIIQFPSQS